MKTGSHTINSNRNDRCDVLLKQVLKLAKFRHPQCAKITSREMFETANREIYQLAKKTRFTVIQIQSPGFHGYDDRLTTVREVESERRIVQPY